MWADVRNAFAFLTILPVGVMSPRPPGGIFAYFPLVGVMIGIALALMAANTVFSADLTAFLVLLMWVILTGGLHLDGFGDSCDGLIATVPPERRLVIMKDPQAGTWAVVGLILLLLGKWLALRDMAPMLLLIVPAAARWTMTAAACTFPYARQEGLGAYFRAGLGRTQLLIATALLIGIASATVTIAGPTALLALVVGPVLLLTAARWAAHRLGGGLTGDVYGALCELTELLCLWIFAAL